MARSRLMKVCFVIVSRYPKYWPIKSLDLMKLASLALLVIVSFETGTRNFEGGRITLRSKKKVKTKTCKKITTISFGGIYGRC